MPWKLEHKEQSRDKIVGAAAHLFTMKGYDAISIDDVMNEAGLTRGAFYSHFSSKAELYNEAVLSAARCARKTVSQGITSFQALVERYLNIGSESNSKNDYCPLAFLVTDICHRDEQVKATYTHILRGYQAVLSEFDLSEAASVQASILLVGGLALSRAVSDETMRNTLLASSYSAVMALAENEMRDRGD